MTTDTIEKGLETVIEKSLSWCKIQVKNFFTEQQHILQKNEIQGLVICPPIILEHAFQ